MILVYYVKKNRYKIPFTQRLNNTGILVENIFVTLH